LRYGLSYRDLEEMMAERAVSVDHSTIARWVLHFGPILNDLIRREMRRPNRSWRVDESYGALSSVLLRWVEGFRCEV
jgi:transposase-like protein